MTRLNRITKTKSKTKVPRSWKKPGVLYLVLGGADRCHLTYSVQPRAARRSPNCDDGRAEPTAARPSQAGPLGSPFSQFEFKFILQLCTRYIIREVANLTFGLPGFPAAFAHFLCHLRFSDFLTHYS